MAALVDDADGQISALIHPAECQRRCGPFGEHVDPGRLLDSVARLDGSDGEGRTGRLFVVLLTGGCPVAGGRSEDHRLGPDAPRTAVAVVGGAAARAPATMTCLTHR